MRLVVIESPFGKNVDGTTADDVTVEENKKYLRACIADCISRGEAPFASHGLYPGTLDDRNPTARVLGMTAGWAWQKPADAIVVYMDRGITPGMTRGIEHAQTLKKKIERRSLGGVWKTKDGIVLPSEEERRVRKELLASARAKP